MATRPRKWQRRRDARPAELVAAATQCFAESGFAATRLEDVAAVAGVSKATVYLYFDGKERLFEEVVRTAVTPRLDQAEALVAAYSGATPDLVRTLLGVFLVALDGPFPAIAKIVIAESSNFPELAKLWTRLVIDRGFRLLTRIIERGIERGEFREVDPAATAPLLVAPVLLLAIFQQAFGKHAETRLDRKAVLTAHAETVLAGLARQPADRRQP